jgi:16S rRNA (cytosine967-C5)-methyltransferase
MLVSRSVGVEGHLRVLDLCAAPGGKTTHLAALGAGRVVAVERNPGRARALRETCRRMRADVAEVVEADAATAGSSEAPAVIGPDARFDAVLVDPPCSGLGTLQSRPDIRWRASEASIAELASLQGRILAAAARVTAPGGTVVYSVCTVSAVESLSVVEGFLAAHADFAAEPLAERHPSYATAAVGPYLQLLPDREGTDGFFIARLIRTV